MSGEQWGEAVDAAALAISVYDWHNGLSGNPEIGKHQRAEAKAAIAAAAELIVADTRRKVAEELWPVLIAHQRHRGGCLCGWNELGRCHAKHIIAAWQATTHEEDTK